MEKKCPSCGSVFKNEKYKLCPYCGTKLNSRVGREPIPSRVRHAVFQKYKYRCCECGAKKSDGATLEIDHIVPVAKGGTNDISNLQVLCKECNRGKYTDTWVGGKLDSDSDENIFGIKTRKEKLKMVAEMQRREVEAKRNKLFDKIFPIITDNQIIKLRSGNYTLENSSKTEVIKYLVNNFSEEEINSILKSIEDLKVKNQEYKSKSDVVSFCIIKCKDIYYYYYKSSSKRYGRFYGWSEDELKEKVLINGYPWCDIKDKWYTSHMDKFINNIYSKYSISNVKTINKFSDYVSSSDLRGIVIDSLDPIKPKGFSAHGYNFCECGNKITHYDRYCSECKPYDGFFVPIKKPKLTIKYIQCPNCGQTIKENALRCKYCKTILKKY